jgi:hypothetical protein
MTVRELHQQAMDTMIDAMRAHQLGEEEKSVYIYGKAFDLENQAALLALTNENTTDLTWSVLCRSAAWLAIQAGLFVEAEKIALTALARGANPEEKNKLIEAFLTALKKQGYDLLSFTEEKPNASIGNIRDRELLNV